MHVAEGRSEEGRDQPARDARPVESAKKVWSKTRPISEFLFGHAARGPGCLMRAPATFKHKSERKSKTRESCPAIGERTPVVGGRMEGEDE